MYITYFKKIDNTYRVFDGDSISNCDDIRQYQMSQFSLLKPYTATDEDLIKFHNNLQIWKDEIFKELRYDYFKTFTKTDGTLFYQSHSSNISSLLIYYIYNRLV